MDFKRGKLDGAKTEIPYQNPADRLRREEWTLTDTGNWQEYKIDQNGDGDYSDNNDLDQDRTHNDVNEIGGISELGGQSAWADPDHSARGNMTTVPKPADMENTYSCTYDAWNRLVEVKDGANVVAHYRYDGLGRRVRKYEPDGENWTVTEYYYSAGWQVLEIRRDDSKTRSGDPLSEPTLATTLREQYVWSPRYIDAPILRDRETDDDPETGDLGKTGSGLDERLYYLTDAHMNVTTLVDTGGDAVERYVYDPYGKVTILDDNWTIDDGQVSDVDNRIMYSGYHYDAETGLYHVRNRYYHPQLGRFISRDPIGYADSMNLYEYVGGGAVDALDPMGLKVWIVFDAAFNTPSMGKHSMLVITNPGYIDKGIDREVPKTWRVFEIGSKVGIGWLLNLIGQPLEHTKKNNPEFWKEYLQKGTWVSVENTSDYDLQYLEAGRSIKNWFYLLYSNNCVHYTRQIIEKAGGSWPLKCAINRGANPGNPAYSPQPPRTPQGVDELIAPKQDLLDSLKSSLKRYRELIPTTRSPYQLADRIQRTYDEIDSVNSEIEDLKILRGKMVTKAATQSTCCGRPNITVDHKCK